MNFEIGKSWLTISKLVAFDSTKNKISLNKSAIHKVKACRLYLDKKLKEGKSPIYGVNTGFGSLCKVEISNENLEELQVNLIRSHACGVGNPIDPKLVKLILLLKIANLSKGYSGASITLIDTLIALYNKNILPVIYEYGSLGASGDLAPLAHVGLTLIGEGKSWKAGKKVASKSALVAAKIKPYKLRPKEGLALLNGTQFSTAFATYTCHHGLQLLHKLNLISSLSLIAFKGNKAAFDPKVHEIRLQKGQIICAAEVLRHLKGVKYKDKNHVSIQDPYSIRCVPQVHGASLDALNYAKNIIEREMNAVTDNPNIFIDSDEVISAGNFHAQPIALVLDQMNIALAELGNISERRTFQLLSGSRGLPDFLIDKPGLNSGMMIAQYTAASLVNQNKTWCMPNSVDSIVSSNGQEDHVSMAANSGTKSYRIVDNLYLIAGIELI